jgi:hypothetical protein
MSCIRCKSHVLAQVIVIVDNACAFIVYTYSDIWFVQVYCFK